MLFPFRLSVLVSLCSKRFRTSYCVDVVARLKKSGSNFLDELLQKYLVRRLRPPLNIFPTILDII